jgi:S-DNA-T family DNA segregation ATPase FtsK/SpoIIIE
MTVCGPVPVVVPGPRWMWLITGDTSVQARDVVAAASASRVDVSDGGDHLVVDDVPWPGDTEMAEISLMAGTTLGVGHGPASAPHHHDGVVTVAVTSGVAAGDSVTWRRGRYLVGAAVEPLGAGLGAGVGHAVIIDVDDGPRLTVTHLSGPAPRCGDHPVSDGTAWPAHTPLTWESVQLRWWPAGLAPEPPELPPIDVDDPSRRVVQRRGRRGDEVWRASDPDVVAPPANRPALVPAVVGASTALTVAVVTGHVLFALFAFTSLAVTAVWWGGVSLRHEHRRRSLRRRRDDQGLARRRQRPWLHEVMAVAQRRRAGLWERRAHRHHDVWQVVVGQGRERDAEGHWFCDVPVAVELGPGARVGVGGTGAAALVRAMLAQLITQVGPADVRVTLHRAADDLRWHGIEVIPQARGSAAHDVIVVVDGGVGVSPLSLATPQAALVVVDSRNRDDSLDAWCSTVMRWDGRQPDISVLCDGQVVAEVTPAGVSPSWWHRLMVTLVPYRDPEQVGPSSAEWVPGETDRVSWRALHPERIDEASILQRWNSPRTGLSVRLGRQGRDVVELDLTRDGPHALIAGTTGSGKSELLRTLVLGAAWWGSPQQVQFVLVDYKGGAAFDACRDLPHVVGVVTDLDVDMGRRVLAGLQAELLRRERFLRQVGAADITQAPLPRLVVVIDEVAALVQELPEVMSALIALAQRGRSLGMHLVLATQRPAGVIRDDIRANTDVRVCLRVADRADALDVIGDPRPAAFPRTTPGRALLRRGVGEVHDIQVADTSAPWSPRAIPVWLIPVEAPVQPQHHLPPTRESSTLHMVVQAVVDAAVAGGFSRAAPLWQPPLPAVLQGTDEPGAVGMLDDVARQCWTPLRSDPAGHVLVVGAPGSGISHTLECVVDTRGGHQVMTVRPELAVAPFMQQLMAMVDDRCRARASTPPVTVVMDGVGVVRSRWEHELGDARWQVSGIWDRLLTEGPRVGITVVAGADRVASCGTTLVSVAATRWLMRPLDPLDAGLLGVRLPNGDHVDWPPGRLVDAATGLVGHVALRVPSTMWTVRSAS